ncbi:MAG: hypothetical protein WKF62_07850 [Solirubrobacterales bacterium]
MSWYVTTGTAPADAHPAGPPPPPVAPPEVVEEIPAEDAGRYRSHVTSIRPSIPGLEARIVGGQDKFEISWTGREPLVVEGYGSEPMIRMSAAGIEVNRRSPSSYLSGDRYAAITVPPQAGPGPPSWRPLESAGTISWYDHRAQWMRPERPAIVGDGTRGVTIFHWSVPARIGDRRISIRGALDWLPDPAAVRAERSDTSSPLLSAGLLAGVAALGAAAGVRLRRRIEKAL